MLKRQSFLQYNQDFFVTGQYMLLKFDIALSYDGS